MDALDEIQENIWNCGGGQITQYGLPSSRNRKLLMLSEERGYRTETHRREVEVEDKCVLLNKKQMHCYDTILSYIDKRERAYNGFFISAPGGTGTTFVFNLILDSFRSK